MANDLSTSSITRQNVLNNKYALQEIQKAVGLRGVLFEGEYKFVKKQVANFFEVDERTINTCLKKNEDELSKNGYDLLKGNALKLFKLAIEQQVVQEVNFPNKTRQLYCSRRFLFEMENLSYHLAAGRIEKELLQRFIHSILENEEDFSEELKLDYVLACGDGNIGFDE